MGKGSKPILSAMLVCDSVITEAGTNKKSLIGVFENINAHEFPVTHHLLAVYVKLTEAHGKYRFRLELVDLKGNTIIGKMEIPRDIDIESPLESHELVFNLPGLKFEHPGKYEFRILANNNMFGQKTFLVKEIPQRGH
jgi:hypothetical protein